jgi:hypothetical protein
MLKNCLLTLALCALVSSCSAPGLRETVPAARVSGFNKIVVVSAIGDRTTYHRQGLVKGDVNPLQFPDAEIDLVVAKRASAVIAQRLGLEVAPYLESNKALFSLYNGRAAPGNAGLEFSQVRSELLRISEQAGADTIVLIFKGVTPLPGGMGGPGYWVQGAAVSNMRGHPCALVPNAMIAIVPRSDLRPIASNSIPTSRAVLPPDICDGMFLDPSADQVNLIRATLLRLVDERAIRSGFESLMAP